MGLEIRLLGALEAGIDGAAVSLPPGRPRGLLAWLALNPGPHPRSRVAAWFWPDVLDASARASLRSALWALRGALGPAGGRFLAGGREEIGLRDQGLTVDIRDFRRLARLGRFAEAVTLCRGDLLYELDDDWVIEEREAHAEQLARVLAGLTRRAVAAGDRASAAAWARRRAGLRPLDEAAGRELIRRLCAAGDVTGAMLTYQRLHRRLRQDLGLRPSRSTRELVGRLCGQQLAAGRGLAS